MTIITKGPASPTTEFEISVTPGLNYQFICKDNLIYEPLGMIFTFVTDDTAADREIRINFSKPTGVFYTAYPPSTISASLTTRLVASNTAENKVTTLISRVLSYNIPLGMHLLPNYKIDFIVTNIQAGDAFDSIALFFNTWNTDLVA